MQFEGLITGFLRRIKPVGRCLNRHFPTGSRTIDERRDYAVCTGGRKTAEASWSRQLQHLIVDCCNT